MLVGAGAGAPAAPVGVAPAPTPVAVTAAFYHWYVMKFRSDHDPILELRAEARGRVSTALLNEIDAQAEDGVSDRDYFLQENDVVRPCRSVAATPLGTGPRSADVAVTLASRTTAPWRLRVSLVMADGSWRIRRVARDGAHPSAAAATRALSDC